MRVLVTGGCGFIGSHLVEKLLVNNHKVIVVDDLSNGRRINLKNIRNKHNLKIYVCDITKKNSIKKHFKKVDWVFHLAALADIVPSIEKPRKYYNVNVLGTLNVLECCLEHNIKKIVYTSSSSSFGIPKKYPTKEEELIDPQYPYALTKHMGEELVLHWARVYKLNALSLKLFNVYGPKSRTTGTYGAVFGVFLAQKISGNPLTVVGDGKQKRDFTYVTDVVEALYLAIKSKSSGISINIGSGKTYSINKLVSLIGGEKVHIPKRPGEPDRTWAEISKAKKILKWTPKISLEKGVKLMLKEIKWWKKAPIWTPKKIDKATEIWFKYLS